MANNEVNAVPAANDTSSSGSSTGPAAGPLAVSERRAPPPTGRRCI
jgi:hypothetical protein